MSRTEKGELPTEEYPIFHWYSTGPGAPTASRLPGNPWPEVYEREYHPLTGAFAIARVMHYLDIGCPGPEKYAADRLLAEMVDDSRDLMQVLVEFVEELESITDHWLSAFVHHAFGHAFREILHPDSVVGLSSADRSVPIMRRWLTFMITREEIQFMSGSRDRGRFTALRPEEVLEERTCLKHNCRTILAAWELLEVMFPQFHWMPWSNYGFLLFEGDAEEIPDRGKAEYAKVDRQRMKAVPSVQNEDRYPSVQVSTIRQWLETRFGDEFLSGLGRETLLTDAKPEWSRMAFAYSMLRPFPDGFKDPTFVFRFHVSSHPRRELQNPIAEDGSDHLKILDTVKEELRHEDALRRQMTIRFLRALFHHPETHPDGKPRKIQQSKKKQKKKKDKVESWAPHPWFKTQEAYQAILSLCVEILEQKSIWFGDYESFGRVTPVLYRAAALLPPVVQCRVFGDLLAGRVGAHGEVGEEAEGEKFDPHRFTPYDYHRIIIASVRAISPWKYQPEIIGSPVVQEAIVEYILILFTKFFSAHLTLTAFPETEDDEDLPVHLKLHNFVVQARKGATTLSLTWVGFLAQLVHHPRYPLAKHLRQKLWDNCFRKVKSRMVSFVDHLDSIAEDRKRRGLQEGQVEPGREQAEFWEIQPDSLKVQLAAILGNLTAIEPK